MPVGTDADEQPARGAIRQDEINNILWKACDTFRGAIDPSEYKNYILVMLFLKYISDVWRDHYRQLRERYGDDDRRIRRQLQYERFVLPEGCDYYSLYDQRDEANVGELINITLEGIKDANKEKLDGVFRNIDFNSEANLGRTRQRNDRLKNLLTDFHDPRLDMSPSRIGNLDVIGNAYEYLIGGSCASGASWNATSRPRRPASTSAAPHLYLGRQYRLKVLEAPDETETVKLARGHLYVWTPDRADAARIRGLLDTWYHAQASRVFRERLRALLPPFHQFGVMQPELVIKPLRARWGSCGGSGVITLNLALIQAPKPHIDYVLVHELSHLVERNHGKRFYGLLDRMLPAWRERRRQLNEAHIF